MQKIKVVAECCSRDHGTPASMWLSEGVPYADGDPAQSYRVRSSDGVSGWLGPVLAPNAEGRAPYRPLDIRGVLLAPGEIRVLELDVYVEGEPPPDGDIIEDPVDVEPIEATAPIAEMREHVAAPTQDGIFFGSRLFQPEQWNLELNSPGRVIWCARGPLPGFEHASHAAPECRVRMTFRPGSPLVDVSIKVHTTYSLTKGTFEKVTIPPMLWRTKSGELPFIDFSVERGGTDPLTNPHDQTQSIFLQPETVLGAGQQMTFFGIIKLGGVDDVWRNRTTGGTELLTHADMQDGNLPPHGFLGGKLHPNDSVADEQTRVRDGFENMLYDFRREVALGGYGTRSVFHDPGTGAKFATACRANPSGQGWQAGFGHSMASLTYADGVGFPYMKRILRYYASWDVQRPITWIEHETGKHFDPTARPWDVFWMGAPHTNKYACPSQLGMQQGAPRHHSGGLHGFDAQHWNVSGLAQLYLHDLHPEWREALDSMTCAYLAERVSAVGMESNPSATVDATRSWRAERGAAIIYACTGDERIPMRFAERLPVYGKLGYWMRNRGMDEFFVPYIEAARRGLPIVRPYFHGPASSQLNANHSPEWETCLGITGACDMARIIRSYPPAVRRAKAVAAEEGFGEDDILELFEKAIGDHYSQWLAETGFLELGILEVVRGLAWPKKQADGWPQGWSDPNNLETLHSKTSHYADWVMFAVSAALESSILGRVQISDAAQQKAKEFVTQSEQLFLKTPSRWRLGYMQNRSKWVLE